MGRFLRLFVCFTIIGNLFFPGWEASAAELADVCWLTESGTLLRFSVTESGPGHYTYTGMFDDNDGAAFAVSGHVEYIDGTLVGSFSGAKTTASTFKTGIYRVTFDPGTFVGTGEGIRQRYDRLTQSISTDYRNHTLTPTPCP